MVVSTVTAANAQSVADQATSQNRRRNRGESPVSDPRKHVSIVAEKRAQRRFVKGNARIRILQLLQLV